MRPRILHFVRKWTDAETVCWRTRKRVRACSTLESWDTDMEGRQRCPDCRVIVEVLRPRLEKMR